VWGVDLAALYLAHYRNLAAGLLAPYLSIVNSLIHLGAALRTGRYNPGAWSAALLLLPAGLYSAVVITRAAPASARDHARAFLGGVLLHLVAILIILRNQQGPQDGE
jgi:hypothetical protein